MKSHTIRTNIVLDTRLVEAGLKATGLKTRRELVGFALRELLRCEQQKKLLPLKGKVAREGDLAEMRRRHNQCPWSIPAPGPISSQVAICLAEPRTRGAS